VVRGRSRMYLEEVLCAVERGADLRLEQGEPLAAVLGRLCRRALAAAGPRLLRSPPVGTGSPGLLRTDALADQYHSRRKVHSKLAVHGAANDVKPTMSRYPRGDPPRRRSAHLGATGTEAAYPGGARRPVRVFGNALTGADRTCRSQDVGQNVPGSEAVATGPSRSCAAWARHQGARLGSE
jgi:hypothetical protein